MSKTKKTATRRDPKKEPGTFQEFLPAKVAGQLQKEYVDAFKDGRQADARRFCWDYWHVPEQYTLLRTPAWEFFSADLYQELHQSLLKFGQEVLGCHEITPPWLSCYVEGCKQGIHADVPHGPWAFVYSLTDWEARQFKGGRTTLFKPEALQFWTSFESMKGVEEAQLFNKVEPHFNQLYVFDPRVPHGVEEVRGVSDPAHGRIVIHGWFVEPKPFVLGGLAGEAHEEEVAEVLNDFLEDLSPAFDEYSFCHGTMSIRLEVASSGKVSDARFLTNTLQALNGDTAAVEELNEMILDRLRLLFFPKSSKPSQITLPILFRF